MYSWASCQAASGFVIADLPDLWVPSIKSVIGQYESTTATLPIPTAPVDWVRATEPYASFLVYADTEAETVMWGGIITKRTRSAGDTVALSVATVDSYFDRRFVGDETYSQVGQLAIAKDLATKYIFYDVYEDGQPVGPSGLNIDIKIIGEDTVLRDRTYTADSDKSMYSVLQDLAGVENGIEWWVGWEYGALEASPPWGGTPFMKPVLYLANQGSLGARTPVGLAPSAVFEMPGDLIQAQLDEDWSDGAGANVVMAVSTADGDTRPQSSIHTIPADEIDRPAVEYRFTPSTSITTVSVLDAHAERKLLDLEDGTRTLYLQSVAGAGPQFGIDWHMGDDIGAVIGGIGKDGRDTVPAFPGGLSVLTRTVGLQKDFGKDGAPDLVTVITTLSGDL